MTTNFTISVFHKFSFRTHVRLFILTTEKFDPKNSLIQSMFETVGYQDLGLFLNRCLQFQFHPISDNTTTDNTTTDNTTQNAILLRSFGQ